MGRSVLMGGVTAVLVAGVLSPAATQATPTTGIQRAPALTSFAAKKKAKGTLKVRVLGTGTYTVKGKHFRESARTSKSFRVTPGTYKIRAERAQVSPWQAVVKKGQTTRVRVVFRIPEKGSSTPPPGPLPVPADPSPETPSTPEMRLARTVDVQPGATATVEAAPELAAITELAGGNSDGPLTWIVQDGHLVLAASANASPGDRRVHVDALTCITSDSCGHRALITVDVRVRPLEAPRTQPVETFTEASPDRIEGASELAGGSALQLPDEVTVVLGSSDNPGDRTMADRVAGSVGAVVVGGLEEQGIYQLRWTSPQDIDARISALRSDPDVEGVDRGLLVAQPEASAGSSEPPSEMGMGTDHTWPLTQLRAPQAWRVTTGSDVKVGIADTWVVADHPELHVTYRDPRFDLPRPSDGHATHVAGLACARANQGETVGVAWGCPIVSSGTGNLPKWNKDYSAQSLSSAIVAINTVLLGGAKVVNVSLGWNPHIWLASGACLTQQQSNQMASQFGVALNNTTSNQFRRLAKRANAVFTVAAGNNCSPAGGSPFTPADNLDNVISVAAVNSTGNLSAFSNWDAELAAGGGAGAPGIGHDHGVWSTWPGGGYALERGTSMAAPLVAGTAALVRSAHPNMSAAEVGRCLVSTGGTNTAVVTTRDNGLPTGFSPKIAYTGSIPIVDAEAAVHCGGGGPVGEVPGEVRRISVSSDGTEANGMSWFLNWSPDSTKVAFESGADNLVSGDTNGAADVFIRDLSAGTTTRFSTNSSNNQANGASGWPVWSPDGSRIAFVSRADNLVVGDDNGIPDLFIKSVSTGRVQRFPVQPDSGDGMGGMVWSPDGTKIAFASQEGFWTLRVFVLTLETGSVQLVSTNEAGISVNSATYSAAWSPDGQKLAFESYGDNLVPGDSNGSGDIFIKDLSTGSVERVSVDATDRQANGNSFGPSWSPDGTKIAFASFASNLIQNDTNTGGGPTDGLDAFVKELSTGRIQRVSTDSSGQEIRGPSVPFGWSPDGSKIGLNSAANNLVSQDNNDGQDVFAKDMTTGEVQRLSTDSMGREAGGVSGGFAWSPSGRLIALGSSAPNLVGDDNNNEWDLFVKTLP